MLSLRNIMRTNNGIITQRCTGDPNIIPSVVVEVVSGTGGEAHLHSGTQRLVHQSTTPLSPNRSTIHGEFLGYRITLKPRDIPNPRSEQVVKITVKDPNVNSHVVQGLRTYTQYLVSLQVFNPEGDGPTSTVAVMTDEGGEYLCS
ncbi:uncharacterized protein LOC121858518 [Homarus americanus]|uniref:uncharacterized protein LOC121858518 n=1 Tax=Homarus americanus TaxID=6706 RepID=UPI001C44796D|nr:uncharacterized protein LOC121858518 [Homarus americanus]